MIVVDDASTDSTKKLLKKHKTLYSKLVSHQQNKGKAAAVREAILRSSGDFVLIQDADLEYHPSDYAKLLKPIASLDADVVYGSRFKGEGPHRTIYFTHYLGNQFITFLSNVFTNINLTDIETGYKVIRKDLLDQINLVESGFGIEPELTIKLSRMKPKIFEVGIAYNGRTYEEGKKIGIIDSLQALWVVLKYGLRLDYFWPRF